MVKNPSFRGSTPSNGVGHSLPLPLARPQASPQPVPFIPSQRPVPKEPIDIHSSNPFSVWEEDEPNESAGRGSAPVVTDPTLELPGATDLLFTVKNR